MKKTIKLFFLLFICIALLPVFSISAQPTEQNQLQTPGQDSGDGQSAPKEEVVYANLSASGNVEKIYTVNVLNVEKPGKIYDYGKYDSIINLTDTKVIAQTEGKLSVQSEVGRFYYQGNMSSKNLPWIFATEYYLNGTKISSDDLAGKAGNIKIIIKTSKNPEVNVDYYNNYMLQISVNMNTELFTQIAANGATMANAGKNKILNFTIMPKDDAIIEISSTTTEFELEPIQIAALPLAFSIKAPDTSDFSAQLTSLSSAISDLNDGAKALTDGLEKLKDGSSDLADGSSAYKDGLSKLVASGTSLTQSSTQILYALQGLSAAIPSPEIKTLADNFAAFDQGLKQFSAGVVSLEENYKSINGGITKMNSGLNNICGGSKKISSGTQELKSQTTGIDTKITDEIDKLLSEYNKSEFTPPSFTDEKNTVSSVQFVIKTEKIRKAVETTSIEKPEEKLSLWDKIVKLFTQH